MDKYASAEEKHDSKPSSCSCRRLCMGQAKKYHIAIAFVFITVLVCLKDAIYLSVFSETIISRTYDVPRIEGESMRTLDTRGSVFLEKLLPEKFDTLKFKQGDYEDDEDIVKERSRRNAEQGSGAPEKKKKKKKTAIMHLVPDSQSDIAFRKHYNFWKVDEDASHNYLDNKFADYRDGGVKIKKAGIYLVYSQISYQGRRTRYAYQINKNGDDISRCVVSEQHLEYSPHSGEHQSTETFTQCKTSIAVYLKKHDTINIKDLYNHVSSHGFSIKHQPENTYFGLVRLS